ncbi:MAG TPA: response regulator [Gemmataceae bacterium]|jgi:CheY-like chemotaxis protein
MAGLHILVVDDCTDVAATMALFLRFCGHHVELAYDGSSALDRARADKPDVVLLDIALPDMSGHDVARQLREQLFDKPLLILAVTGYGREADRRLSEESGIDMHLVKPVEPLELKKILSRFERVVGCIPDAGRFKASAGLPLARGEVQSRDAEAFVHGQQVIEDGLLEGGLAHFCEQSIHKPADFVAVAALIRLHELAVQARQTIKAPSHRGQDVGGKPICVDEGKNLLKLDQQGFCHFDLRGGTGRV